MIRKRLSDFIASIVLLVISYFIKRQENSIAIGSWEGKRYADNSRYLMEYLDKNYPAYKLYWIGNPEIKEEVLKNTQNVVFLEKDRFTTNIKLLTCKYFFFSQMHDADISACNVFRGSVMCYLHHGMPIKKWAMDGLNQGAPTAGTLKKLFWRITAADKKYDYFVVSSEKHAKSICSALAYKGCTMDKIIRTGTPRNDMFFETNSNHVEALKEKYCHQYGIDNEKKIIMYLPTYRRVSQNIFSFSNLAQEQLCQISAVLKKNKAVIIEKSHCAEKISFEHNDTDELKFADKNTNIQEMMLFTDVLISDYSGAYLDYILLEKPVIHFAYDYEHYKNVDSGLYYEIADFSAGAVSETFDNLLIELQNLLAGKDAFQSKRADVRKEFMTFEKGNASKQIVQSVILKDK